MLDTFFAYIGPGLGAGTLLVIVLVLAIVVASICMILWAPIKSILDRVWRVVTRK